MKLILIEYNDSATPPIRTSTPKPQIPLPLLTHSQLESYYNLSYTIVSLVFLSPLLGYATAAIVNERAHCAIGRRGVAFVSSLCHLIAYILNCVHPPYPVLVVSFIFAGLGNGLADSAWNAWIGNLDNANQLLGLLHGSYGVGAVISPLIASLLVADAGLPWYYFYYIMVRYTLSTIVGWFWLMVIDFHRLEALQSRFSSALRVSGILQERHSDSLRNNNPVIHLRKQACAGSYLQCPLHELLGSAQSSYLDTLASK